MSRLAREIGFALVFKAIALTLLYFAFFRHPAGPSVTPSAMADLFKSGGAPTPQSIR